jgi:hypothetical protein
LNKTQVRWAGRDSEPWLEQDPKVAGRKGSEPWLEQDPREVGRKEL